MSTDFSQLIADIEQEAREEGPQAVRELEQFREEFSLASQIIQSRREGKLSQRDLAKLSGVPSERDLADRDWSEQPHLRDDHGAAAASGQARPARR